MRSAASVLAGPGRSDKPWILARPGAQEQTVRHWIKTRELKASNFGARIGYRIKRSDVKAFLDRRTLSRAIAVQLFQDSGLSAGS